jgi:predicted lipid-binding transport protein (Tim44 family)
MHWGMKMTTDQPEHGADDARAQAFADARTHAPQLRASLRAQIVEQALAPAAPAPRAKPSLRVLRRWFSGWAMPGLAGGALATLAGVWIGASVTLPLAALDMPIWLDAPLGVIESVAIHLIGVDDPLWQEF